MVICQFNRLDSVNAFRRKVSHGPATVEILSAMVADQHFSHMGDFTDTFVFTSHKMIQNDPK